MISESLDLLLEMTLGAELAAILGRSLRPTRVPRSRATVTPLVPASWLQTATVRLSSLQMERFCSAVGAAVLAVPSIGPATE